MEAGKAEKSLGWYSQNKVLRGFIQSTSVVGAIADNYLLASTAWLKYVCVICCTQAGAARRCAQDP